MVEGFITLSRGIREHWIYQKPEYYRAWSDMLFCVNFKDNKVMIDGEILECKRGQSVMSLDSWAKEFGKGWTKQRVRTFFKLLSSDSMIVSEGLRKTTRLTICNYNTYQLGQHTDDTEKTQRQHTGNTDSTPIEEGNKEKKGKKEPSVREKAFEDLWVFYGRVGTKATAKDRILKLSEKDYTEMLSRVREYVSNSNTDGTFPSRMHLSSYVNAKEKKWRNETDAPNKSFQQQQEVKQMKIISNTETAIERMKRLSMESNN